MTGIVRDWLPLDAAAAGTVRCHVSVCVDRWSEKWFSDGALRLSDFGVWQALPKEPSGADWRLHRPMIFVSASNSDLHRLAALALSADLASSSSVDRKIVESLANSMIDDLAGMLETGVAAGAVTGAAMATPDEVFSSAGGGVLTQIGDGLTCLFRLAIPLEPLVRLCKSEVLVSPAARSEPLRSVVDALGETRVPIAGTLGEAVLPLGELARLTVGDVLILDRMLEEGASIATSAHGAAFAHGRLSDHHGAVSILIQPLKERRT